MPEQCGTCGTTASSAYPLVTLNEVGINPGDEANTIQLCPSCLERREAKRWRPSNEDRTMLQEALERRLNPLDGRYTYMEDQDTTVHLMRLRPDWVHDHAAKA